ncbi:hypothetical protein [Fimbriimonas ginsengisoli]|uniref:NosL family protein n=1 Tax=Fimbriimonas ginsengisoli Gsoil 348 TaxID=661478 RepID=A0A068NQA4_FIMGI|nr:hypothetical protein [Fimbriimonas ginsengisoli]AIE83799.1 hypothetical protein OP10G_0431 [Fimbriimonas ginsengisoli Gsoil 348]
MNKTIRILAIGLFVMTGAAIVPANMVRVHEVPCPLCGMKVVQGTKTQDNEVVLRFGRKKIEYRCVYCAIADSKKYDGDLVVYAPSETKGKPVLLTRTAGKWAAVKESEGKLVPESGVVFLNDFDSHDKCAKLSRAFHAKEGFDKYVKGNGAEKSKSMSLTEMVAAALKN